MQANDAQAVPLSQGGPGTCEPEQSGSDVFAPQGGQTSALSTPCPAQPAGPLTLSQLIDAYFAQFTGRDHAREQRLDEWRLRLGERAFASITDDEVFAHLEEIAAQPARIWKGRDVNGQPIYRAKGARAAATVNRYHAALSALFTWAIKRRRAPKGWTNPCHQVERAREENGVVRFLSDEERTRLLAACRQSKWPRLYLLVLMGITTGARRGELLSLRWSDIDRERAVAYLGRTKNGEPKTLPLVPAVLEELASLDRGAKGSLIFASRLRPNSPYEFTMRWQEALKLAKVRKFRFHDLRHTCASYLAQNGASLLEIADVMGHRQLAMVKRYAHLTTKSKAALVNRVLGDIK